MWEDSVVTNAGAALLARWASGGTLVIDGARAGTGTARSVSLASSTKLEHEKQTLSIVSAKEVEKGIQYNIQFDAHETGYTVNQIGIWAHLNSEKSVLIAIYQDESGIVIPSKSDMPDFAYAFYATIQMDNTGELTVNINSNVYVTSAALEQEIKGLAKADLSNVTSEAFAKLGVVSSKRKINGHALDKDIDLNAEDVGARPKDWMPTPEEVGALPKNTEIPKINSSAAMNVTFSLDGTVLTITVSPTNNDPEDEAEGDQSEAGDT